MTDWFNGQYATFGGEDVVQTVKELVGHCAKSDFLQISDKIPHIELADLKPFFLGMLENNRRRFQEDESGLQFKTPDEWYKTDVAIRKEYKELLFDRQYKEDDAMQRVLGVGHRLFDKALEQGVRQTASVTLIPEKILRHPIFVFKISERVTTSGTRASVLFGVEKQSDSQWNILPDWKLLLMLNELTTDRGVWKRRVPVVEIEGKSVMKDAEQAALCLNDSLNEFHLEFQVPETELIGILCPGTAIAEKETPNEIEDYSV